MQHSDQPALQGRAVQVLLATYNGQRFLQQQVNSLLQQDHRNLQVLARDDGSSDGTPALLQQFASSYPERFQLLPAGAPTGSAPGNFQKLLAASTAPYVALCDQDDIWLPDKITSELEAMASLEARHGRDVPLLVFTDLQVVDADGRVVHPSLWKNNGIGPGAIRKLPRLLGENVVTGCTVLMNRAMADLAATMPVAQGEKGGAVMHDHWIALLAATLGHAAHIAKPTVLYRQHSANAVGAAALDDSISGKLRRLFGRAAFEQRQRTAAAMQAQAREFLRCYGPALSKRDKATLLKFSEIGSGSRLQKLRSILSGGYWRGTIARNALSVVDILRK